MILDALEFMQYVSKFGKSYDTLDEFNMRMELYLNIDKQIKEWNAKEGITSTMGHNFFSDFTDAERKRLTSSRNKHPEVNREPTHFAPEGYVKALSTFNWCDTSNPTGVIQCSPLKDQGACWASYAFAGVECVESAMSIFYNVQPVPILSTQ